MLCAPADAATAWFQEVYARAYALGVLCSYVRGWQLADVAGRLLPSVASARASALVDAAAAVLQQDGSAGKAGARAAKGGGGKQGGGKRHAGDGLGDTQVAVKKVKKGVAGKTSLSGKAPEDAAATGSSAKDVGSKASKVAVGAKVAKRVVGSNSSTPSAVSNGGVGSGAKQALKPGKGGKGTKLGKSTGKIVQKGSRVSKP